MMTAILLEATAQQGEKLHLSEKTAFWMFVVGIVVVGFAWTVTPLAFVLKNETETLLHVLRQGSVLRYITITYIVLVAVTLSLVDKLDGDKVATLLASIAGYVLGQATRQREDYKDASTTPKKSESAEKERQSNDETMRETPVAKAG